MIAEETDVEVKDAGLIAAAQRVEHYDVPAHISSWLGLPRQPTIKAEFRSRPPDSFQSRFKYSSTGAVSHQKALAASGTLWPATITARPSAVSISFKSCWQSHLLRKDLRALRQPEAGTPRIFWGRFSISEAVSCCTRAKWMVRSLRRISAARRALWFPRCRCLSPRRG
jgi:hypothetical protein